MFPWKLGHSWLELHYGSVFRDEFWLSSLRNFVKTNERSDRVPKTVAQRNSTQQKTPSHSRHQTAKHGGLYEKKAVPFACAKRPRAPSDHLTFTELNRGIAEPKVFIWRKVDPARRVTQPSQKDDQARRVTLLDKPTFLVLMQTVRQVLQENVWNVGWTRVAGIGGWPIYQRRWNMTLWVSIVLNTTPLWRYCESLSTCTTVLFRTTLTRTIIFHLLIK